MTEQRGDDLHELLASIESDERRAARRVALGIIAWLVCICAAAFALGAISQP